MNTNNLDFDKNAKIIIIPEGTIEIPSKAFSHFTNLEEVIMPDSVIYIDAEAFAWCTSLKKIKLSNKLRTLGIQAFANCHSLEEITIPSSLFYIPIGCFSYCRNLKTLNLHDNVKDISSYALYNCRKLTNFKLPNNINNLGVKSLSGCNKIKEIHIPKNLEYIESGALSLMSSLSKITVDPENSRYISDKGIALIDKKEQTFIQYAINNKEKEYKVETVSLELQQSKYSCRSFCDIYDYAFAGAKHLEKIYIPSEIKSIGPKTFLNCNKLETLKIYFTPYGNLLLFNIHNTNFEKAHIPFINIEIEDGVTTITDNKSDLFENAINVVLPSTLKSISTNVFSKSKKLKRLNIPNSIKNISSNTFHDSIILNIEDFKELPAYEFNMLETKISSEYYVRLMDLYSVKIFSLKNGTYYINFDGIGDLEITKAKIKELSDTSYILENDPDILIRYLHDLLEINAASNHLINNIINSKRLKEKFKKFVKNMSFVKESSLNKNKSAIYELLEEKNLNDEILFNGILMSRLNKKDILNIIENYSLSLQRFVKFSEFFDKNKIKENTFILNKVLLNIPKLIDYCNLLEKYQKYDRFLYNPKFFMNFNIEEQTLLIKNFNNNIKRFLKESEVLEIYDHKDYNLRDLLKFAFVMGVFDDNFVLSQKTCTFITEKIFSENLSNGHENMFRIVGDDIHRVFNELLPRDELDLEFILFFIENYKELIDIEKNTSGFTARVYNSFREISKCCTSNKGSQRHLKVTIKKCIDYFLFDVHGITDDNKELAELLAKYYSVKEVFEIASSIVEQAKNAPRNIFTKVEVDADGNAIYDNDPVHDLKNVVDSGFSYEWLPKQSYDNLILGKYCNCCAHIDGVGAGIMRASMILDCCQNLVIRDAFGMIVAKMTLYVNKEGGYAVFNTVEGSFRIKNDKALPKVYEAFMKGVIAFCDRYNEANLDNPLHTITIGQNRNILIEILHQNNHKEISPYKVIDYSSFGYALNNRMVGTYTGDSFDKQLLVLSKK